MLRKLSLYLGIGVLLVAGFLLSTSLQVHKNLKQTVVTSITPPITPSILQTALAQRKEITVFSVELRRIVYQQDPRAAFVQLHSIVDSNKNALANCHSLTHSIGDAALEKYQDINIAMAYEDEFCGSGYIHGVIETKIGNSKDLYHDLLTLCSEDSGNCLHGIGHGLMYYTANDIPKSLSYCDVLPGRQAKIFCSEGVFMENFNTDILSHSSNYLHADDTRYPCSFQKEMYKGACYFYSSDYYLQLHKGDYSGAFIVCNKVEPRYIQTCINGTGSRMMKRNILDPKFVEGNCMKVRGDYQSACIDGMVSYYIVNYYSLAKGRELCTSLDEKNKEQCNKSVVYRKDLFPE